MKADRPQPNYGCSQQDLYTVGDTVANSYNDHAASFTPHNTKFTATTGTDLKATVKAAREMPGEAQRDAAHSLIRKDLLELRDECLIKWQQLETSITEAFDKDEQEDQLEAAGHGFYASAQNDDWDDVNGLMSDAKRYVIDNETTLVADGGMPTGFLVELGDAASAFSHKYEAFLQSLEGSKESRDAKINADNAVYKEVMRICNAGKRIFRKEAAIREQFTFETVLWLVMQARTKHGLGGVVKKVSDGAVIGQAKLLLERLRSDGNYEPVEEKLSDNDGLFKFMVVNGKYRLTAGKVGFISVQQSVTIAEDPVEVEFELEEG